MVIPETTMKQFKWIPVSDLIQKTKKPDRKKLFNGAGEEGENSRTSLGLDEDSNMSNISTASDSLDGPPTLTALIKPETSSEDGVTKRTTITAEGGIYKGELSEEGARQGRGEYIWPNGDRSVLLIPTVRGKFIFNNSFLSQIRGRLLQQLQEREWHPLLQQRRQEGWSVERRQVAWPCHLLLQRG